MRVLLCIAVICSIYCSTCAQPYQVNNEKYTEDNCASMDYDMSDIPLTPIRGTPGAPCVGYLTYMDERMCTAPTPSSSDQPDEVLFFNYMAKRACYTLGTNMYKDGEDDIMLYSCDRYTGPNVDFPRAATPVTVALVNTGDSIGPDQGKRCLPATPNLNEPDSNCLIDCYNLVTDLLETSDACQTDLPYWATTCTDIDECQNGVLRQCQGPFESHCNRTQPCGYNTKCTNQPGSWLCECLNGFEQSVEQLIYDELIGCTDIDECLDANICGGSGQCINTVGSYFCLCQDNSIWDQTTKMCIDGVCGEVPDIPNAEPRSNPASSSYNDEITYDCDEGHLVYNQKLFYALLPFPYYRDLAENKFELLCSNTGKWSPEPYPSCVPINCGPPNTVLNARRIGGDFHYEKTVTYWCNEGFNVNYDSYPYPYPYLGPQNEDHYLINCQADGTWTYQFRCEDIDECESDTACGLNEQCVNTVGSFLCICQPGYGQLTDGSNCVELVSDACETMDRLKLCQHGVCQTKDGKAECSCDAGYMGLLCENPTEDLCEKIMSLNQCVHGKCSVKNGKATCNCELGYTGSTCDEASLSLGAILAILALVLIFLLFVIMLCIRPLVKQGAPFNWRPTPPPMPPPRHGGFPFSFAKRGGPLF